MTTIEDATFYNIVGELISRKQIVQDMIDYYYEKLEAGETRITDFNEGSEIRNLLEAISVLGYNLHDEQYNISRLPFISTAYGEWLDLHGENPNIGLARDTGNEARGVVTFTIPDVLTGDFIIPEGTIVSSESTGLEFATDYEGYIMAGDTSCDVFCICLTTGEDGNVPANDITVVDDTYIDGDVTVTNNEAFTEGTDYEEDDEYRERLLNVTRSDGFGSLGYYTGLADSIDGVHDVLFVEDEQYTRKILVNGEVKPTTDKLLLDVLTVFTDTDNKVLNHNFTVAPPNYTYIDLDIVLNVEENIEEQIIRETLDCFFDGGITSDGLEFEGLNIGEDLTRTALYNALELLDFVDSVTVNVNDDELKTLNINEDAVFRLRDVNISQNVLS